MRAITHIRYALMNLQTKSTLSIQGSKAAMKKKEGKFFKHHSYDIPSKLETDHILQEEIKQRIEFIFSRERFGSEHQHFKYISHERKRWLIETFWRPIRDIMEWDVLTHSEQTECQEPGKEQTSKGSGIIILIFPNLSQSRPKAKCVTNTAQICFIDIPQSTNVAFAQSNTLFPIVMNSSSNFHYSLSLWSLHWPYRLLYNTIIRTV